MEITRFVKPKQRELLAKARATYGDLAELSVSAEELNELAIMCNKFCRYKTKESAQEALHDSVLTEVADVLIVLDHIVSIFDLTPVEILEQVNGKIKRLEGWLNKSNDMEQTTIDREIPGQTQIALCPTCDHMGDFNNLKPGGICLKCVESGNSLYKPKEGEDEAE